MNHLRWDYYDSLSEPGSCGSYDARHLRSILPFAGSMMLCIGDFRQILHVSRAASRSQIVSTCFKRSHLFPIFKRLQLHNNMRLLALRNDPHTTADALEFAWYFLKAGDEKCQTDDKQHVFLSRPVTFFSLRWSHGTARISRHLL